MSLAGDEGVPANCRCCGACCFSPSALHVRVTGEDWSRLGAMADELAQFIGNRAYMRMPGGRCAALAVHEDDDGFRDFVCTIYESRPQICRDLARGSPECAGEIALRVSRG